VTVERSYGPLRSVGGPFLLVIGLLGSGGLAYARREHELALTPAERDYLSYSDDRSEFAEWITTFRLPASVHERSEAEAESLRDLVDFAIDNDIGVIADPETGTTTPSPASSCTPTGRRRLRRSARWSARMEATRPDRTDDACALAVDFGRSGLVIDPQASRHEDRSSGDPAVRSYQ